MVADNGHRSGIEGAAHIPLRLKITAVLLVSAIGFGGHWSSGVTGAMKSTLKKVRINDQSDVLTHTLTAFDRNLRLTTHAMRRWKHRLTS